MIDELVLHIGPAKTGTTSIQEALAATATEQAAAGTFVPRAEGAEPGQHLPILLEVVGDASYRHRYAFSQDVLSLQAVLRDAAEARCRRLLISSERFAWSTDSADVLHLIRAIGPRRLVIVRAVRSVTPWALSHFAQQIVTGLFEVSTWPVDRFSEWFADVFLPGSMAGVEQWRDGPWTVSQRTMFLPADADFDVAGVFGSVAELPVPLRTGRPANRRLDPCQLHFLQALNLITFDGFLSISDRTVQRESVVAALKAGGAPAHECSCGQLLESEVRRFLEDRMARIVPSLLAISDVVVGDPKVATVEVSAGDLVHCRFPDVSSIAVAAVLLSRALDEVVARLRAVTEARDFWHTQAAAWEEEAAARN